MNKSLLLLALLTSPLHAENLMPHKALYSLSLMSEKPHEGVDNATGEFALEFTGNKCTGYIFNQKIVVDIQNDNTVIRSEMVSTNFEAGDSKTFQYTLTQKLNGDVTENHAGKAVRGVNETVVKITQPKDKEVKLASTILFPNEHMIGIIKAAKKGEKLFSEPLFDGSLEGGKHFNSLTIIGKPSFIQPDSALVKGVESVNKWGINVGYIEEKTGNTDGKVDFSIALTLLENGIATTVDLINPAFSLRGSLKKLELLPQEKCN